MGCHTDLSLIVLTYPELLITQISYHFNHRYLCRRLRCNSEPDKKPHPVLNRDISCCLKPYSVFNAYLFEQYICTAAYCIVITCFIPYLILTRTIFSKYLFFHKRDQLDEFLYSARKSFIFFLLDNIWTKIINQRIRINNDFDLI